MSELKAAPSKAELHNWRLARETKWVINQLRKQFPQWPASMPPKSLEHAHENSAREQIFEAIDRICG